MRDITTSPGWLCRLTRGALLSVLLTWVIAACAGSPTSTPSPAQSSTPSVTPSHSIALQPCTLAGYSAECGTLAVFENRAAQSGRKIDLKVAVIRARDADPSPDPIFWLAGGPGAAATEDVWWAVPTLEPAIGQRDLVFVDQRGTGGSNKLECPVSADPARQVDDLRACLADLGSDPRAYTTAWAMDDLDDVRAALGYDRINLYGESYGATAAQVYVMRHEASVRTASLVGGTLLDVPVLEGFPVSSQNALEATLARCEADASCHLAYPNLRQELASLRTRLDQGPIATSLVDPQTGKHALFTREDLDTGIHQLLAVTEATAILPKAIHLADSGDWQGLAALLAQAGRGGSSAPDSAPTWKVMRLAILCNEDWAKLRSAETESLAAGSYLRYEDVRSLTLPEGICSAVPAPEASALYCSVTGSTVPILLVNGAADPQDPPANVAGAKQRYPSSLSLVAPGQAHVYTGIPCRSAIYADFIDRSSVDGLETACLDKVALPPFVP